MTLWMAADDALFRSCTIVVRRKLLASLQDRMRSICNILWLTGNRGRVDRLFYAPCVGHDVHKF